MRHGRQVPEGSGEQGKMEKTGCKIICGAPTTLAVKGLMMMMMNSKLGKEVVVQTVISCVQPEDGHLTCSYGSVCDLSKRELGL